MSQGGLFGLAILHLHVYILIESLIFRYVDRLIERFTNNSDFVK